MRFAVGDRVRYIASGDTRDSFTRNNFRIDGETGSIVRIDVFIHAVYGVRFDKKFDGGHNIDHCCDDGYGWWCCEESLELALEHTAEELYEVWEGNK